MIGAIAGAIIGTMVAAKQAEQAAPPPKFIADAGRAIGSLFVFGCVVGFLGLCLLIMLHLAGLT